MNPYLLSLYKHARADGKSREDAHAIATRELARTMSTLARMNMHAREPWTVQQFAEESADGTGFSANMARIACGRGHFMVALVSDDAPMSETNATAARVVECVNALAGVPDPIAYIAELRAYKQLIETATS